MRGMITNAKIMYEKRQCLHQCIVNVLRDHENRELTSEPNDRLDLSQSIPYSATLEHYLVCVSAVS